LQISGWAPVQRVSLGKQIGTLQVPLPALHSAAVMQAAPLARKPVRPALQICGSSAAQRTSSTSHAGNAQVDPPAASVCWQSASVLQVTTSSQPLRSSLQRFSAAPLH
jgi:hypothetical protein